MRTRPHSFVGGELSTAMFGRPDDPKYAHGAARMRNVLTVGPAGEAMGRPGSRFVRAARNPDRKCRLIPYGTGGGEAFQVELGYRQEFPGSSAVPGYARFHRNAATVLHSTPWSSAASYVVGDVVRDSGTLYLCVLAHSNQAPPDVTYWKSLEYVADTSFAPGSVNVGTDEITLGGGHDFADGDPLDFTNDTGGAAIQYEESPGVFVPLTFAHAIVVSSTVIQVSLTEGGAALNLVGTGTGTHRVHRRYTAGELVSIGGAVFYCRKTRPINGSGVSIAPNVGDEDYWYEEPATGEYEIPTTLELTEADLFAATYSQQEGILSIATGKTFVCELVLAPTTLIAPANWRWVQASFAPTLPAPSGVAAAATKRGAAIAITTSVGVGPGSSRLAMNTETEHRLVPGLDFVFIEGHTTANGFFGVESGGNASQFVLTEPETGAFVAFVVGGSGGTARVTKLHSDTSNAYVVTAVDDNDRESQPSAEATVDNKLTATGAFNTVTWSAVPGAVRYRVYKQRSATGLFGLIGEAESPTFKDDGIAPELGKTPPKLDETIASAPDSITLAPARNDLPRAVAHMEGRRALGGTVDGPQDVWATRSNTESDLSYTLPIKATDRIRQRIKARVACTIRHLVPLGQLVALTDTTEFRITAVNSDALTPDSFAARAQSYFGAAAVQPVVVDNVLLFVGARGGRVYQMGYSSEANGYLTIDITERVTHLFDGFTIGQMASQRAPVPIVWDTRSDGKLLGLTFVPSQQVFAWHLHDFQGGEVESVSVGGEGAEDRVYVIVKRTIDGNVVRYVEQLAPFGPTAWEDSWLVDCGLRYEGAPVTTITGLEHLEGETVSVFADGLVQSQKVVSSGQIELDVAASKVLVGLPIAYELQTLPAAFAIEAFGAGRPKSVSRVWVRVEASGAFEIGPSLEDMVRPFEIEQAGPGVPFSGEVEVRVPNEWTDTGQLFLRQTDPVPLRVMFITAEMAVGG